MANTHSLDLEESSSQYAYIVDNASLSITGDISVEVWIKLESLASEVGKFLMIANKDNRNSDAQRGYFCYINNADDKFRFSFYDGVGGSTSFTMDEAFVSGDKGTWIHLAATVDVSTSSILFYKNGALKSGTVVVQNATAIKDNSEDFKIGAGINNTTYERFFDGLLDEVRVWNDIRTAQEIEDNYQSELIGNEDNLVGYWKLNNNYLDETSNDNDLTASGSPVFSTDIPFIGLSPARSLFYQQI
jgi:hypothetical protein